MRPSHRAAVAEKKTTQMERPGPKYVLPTGLGGQVESTKRSANSGRFSECPRKTIELGPSRSPGPAAYDLTSIGLKTVSRDRSQIGDSKMGMGGGARRFFDGDGFTKRSPGPGQYLLPSAVGGDHPAIHSNPVFAFSKGERSPRSGGAPHSPGPVYMVVPAVGPQVSSRLRTPAKYGFGTSSRFPVSRGENRAHQDALQRINPKKDPKSVVGVAGGPAKSMFNSSRRE